MLKSTFLHLQNISYRSERNLWNQKLTDWNDFLQAKRIKKISPSKKYFLDKTLRESKQAILEGNYIFFSTQLAQKEHWRAYDEFKEDALYLDIEIDKYGRVTIVTITDGVQAKILIKDINLCRKLLEVALKNCCLLITYNGGSFDLPILKKQFGLDWKGLHIDLKTICRRLGYMGGLKKIERDLKIKRQLQTPILGGDPAKLYRMWRRSGDKYYLQLLLDYNEEDAHNLVMIAKRLIPKLWQRTRNHA